MDKPNQSLILLILMNQEVGNPLNGLLFHKIFDNDDILENLINTVLKMSCKIDKEKTKVGERKRNVSGDLSIGNSVYVHCIQDKIEFIVEIAVKNDDLHLEKTALLTWCREYRLHYDPPNYETLLPIYIIYLTNQFIYSNNKYKSYFKLCDELDPTNKIPLLNYIIFEISKFQIGRDMDEEQEWINFFKNYKYKPSNLKNQVLEKAYHIIQFKNLTDQEYEFYSLLEIQNDDRHKIQQTLLDHHVEGEREDIAMKLIRQNHKDKYIQKITGLSKQKIDFLRSQHILNL